MTMEESGRLWFDVRRLSRDKHQTPLSIVYPSVASHNHFILDRGGKVFKDSVPVIKLRSDTGEDEHFALIAFLNSSAACFWMKQVCFPKAAAAKELHIEGMKPEDNRYAFASGAIAQMPVPGLDAHATGILAKLARASLELADQRNNLANKVVKSVLEGSAAFEQALSACEMEHSKIKERLVALQEDIDWRIYYEFGLTETFLGSSVIAASISQRPRNVVNFGGVVAPGWEHRLAKLRDDPVVGLLEQPLYKRQWAGRRGVFGHDAKTFDDEVRYVALTAVQEYAERIISKRTEVLPASHLLSLLRAESGVLQLFSCVLTEELRHPIGWEHVPYLSCLRFTDEGYRKHQQWLEVWESQRREDEGGTPGEGTPPYLKATDFANGKFFRLRGKLDVPIERFISYPGCESDIDGEPVYGWAGWDHLQRAKALATLYLNRRDQEGWTADRLTPMLAGLLELIPWVKQWHNEPSEEFGGLRMGDYYEQFLDGECRRHGLTHDDLRAWRPAKKARGGKAATKGRAARVDPEAAEAVNGHASEEAAAPKKRRTKKPRAAADGPPAGEEAE